MMNTTKMNITEKNRLMRKERRLLLMMKNVRCTMTIYKSRLNKRD